ncbi:hypothetical protein AB0O91_16785 [Kitasatospora sp. NPDC089797]|uniref:hypothetical protein n=1 Tax=Kitasatospora sp. NPDC089797 TaxID=3155298 RepID=UPI003424047B
MNSFTYVLGHLLSLPGRALEAGRRAWPTDRRLRALADSPPARAARAAERQRIGRTVAALGAVAGVEHLLTRISDHCDRPQAFGIHAPGPQGRPALVCRMSASAYFATREDLAVLLPRIEAAGLAAWGSPDGRTGSPAYALRWQGAERAEDGWRLDPEGWRMTAPDLSSPGALLHWDLTDSAVLRPAPSWERIASRVRLSNEQTPPDADAAELLRTARADGRALVLQLDLRTDWRAACTYYTAGRGGPAWRGREHERRREQGRGREQGPDHGPGGEPGPGRERA